MITIVIITVSFHTNYYFHIKCHYQMIIKLLSFVMKIRLAIIQDRFSRGLYKTIKALKKGQALFCIKAENCDDDVYKKYI